MGNPFDAIDLRLSDIEKLLGHLSSSISNLYLEKVEDSIGIKEAAKILGLSHNTLYTKTHKRLIPHSKQGKILIFSRTALADYISEGRVKTIAEEKTEAENYRVRKLSERQ